MGERGRAWSIAALVGALLVVTAEAWIPLGTERVRVTREPPARAAATLDFQARTVLLGEEGPAWLAQAVADGRFHLHLRFMTYWPEQTGPAWIFAIAADADDVDLLVGQDDLDVVIRVRRARSEPDGTPEVRITDALLHGVPQDLDLTIDGPWLTVQLDDRPVRRVLLAGTDPVATWDAGHRVMIADTEEGGRGWIGGLFEATVGDEALVASDALAAGTGIVEFDRPRVIDRPGDTAPLAIAVRLALFVPLGVVLGWLLRRRVLAVAAGATVVLVIAVGKWFVPGRHPSVAEVVIGVAGVVAGVAVAGWRHRTTNRRSGRARMGAR